MQASLINSDPLPAQNASFLNTLVPLSEQRKFGDIFERSLHKSSKEISVSTYLTKVSSYFIFFTGNPKHFKFSVKVSVVPPSA